MRTLFDTSFITACMIEAHPMHERALPWFQQAKENQFELIVASHTIAELYAVLTAAATVPRISPQVAQKLIHENIETVAGIMSLTPKEYLLTIKQISETEIRGDRIFYAITAKIAEKAQVERLMTLNSTDYKRIGFLEPKNLFVP
ncbi:MAG: type II toxin-antitoxin system VapC family toxin [SAR324 cluster bacterium]|nr:type II toxin-antitoxin system VapC family toxin [SAR324 cluster bacterium]